MCVQLKSKFRNKIFIESFWRWLTKISDPLFFQGKAEGQRSAVWIRARLQDQLSQLGYFLQRHAGKVLFLAIVALATFCVALKSAQIHSKVEQLWVQGEYLFWNIFRKCDFFRLIQRTRTKFNKYFYFFYYLRSFVIWAAKLNAWTKYHYVCLGDVYFKFINFFFYSLKEWNNHYLWILILKRF